QHKAARKAGERAIGHPRRRLEAHAPSPVVSGPMDAGWHKSNSNASLEAGRAQAVRLASACVLASILASGTVKFQHLKISRIKSLILGDSQNSDAKKMTSRMPRRPKH